MKINLDTLGPLSSNTDEYFTPESIRRGSDYFVGYSIWDTCPDKVNFEFITDDTLAPTQTGKYLCNDSYHFYKELPICYKIVPSNNSLYFYMPDDSLMEISQICCIFTNCRDFLQCKNTHFSGIRVLLHKFNMPSIWDNRIKLKFYRCWWRIPLYLYFDFGNINLHLIKRISRYIYGDYYSLFF